MLHWQSWATFPAFVYNELDTSALLYIRATNVQGSAWGAPVSIDDGGLDVFGSGLAVVAGRPAALSFSATLGLCYARANDSNGASWTALQSLHPSQGTGTHFAFIDHGGRPVVAFNGEQDNEFVALFMESVDSIGSSWTSPQILDQTSNCGSYITVASVNGKLGAAYYQIDDEGPALRLGLLKPHCPDRGEYAA